MEHAASRPDPPLAPGTAAPAPGTQASRQATLLTLLVVWASFWAQFAWVRATNFEGFDEWLLLDLTSRGVISAPHANRPVQWIWQLPAALLAPDSLGAVYLLHGCYMALVGCLVVLLLRRLLPDQPLLALLAGTLSVCWAPLDVIRVATVYSVSHAGTTFGMMLAILLLVESLARGRPWLLAAALAVDYLTARGYEGVLPILALAPALLPLVPATPRRRWIWVLAWWVVVGAAAAQTVLPLLGRHDASVYQLSVKPLDLDPWHFVVGLALQYRHHLAPLLGWPAFAIPCALSALVFLLLALLAHRPSADCVEASRRRLLAELAGGLLAAGLGYSALVLGTITDAARAQFFSGPGIGVALAATILLITSLLPARLRCVLALALTAWVVSLGTSYTLEKQDFWQARDYYGRQRRILAGIVARAPDVQPHSLVMLLDDSGAFPATFGFRHAIELLYEHHATGYVWGAADYFYPLRLVPDGFRCEPWPVLRGPWHSPVTHHTFSEMLVFHADAGGRVQLLGHWPEGRLPPLPAEQRYDPEARIRPLRGPPPASRRLIAPRS